MIKLKYYALVFTLLSISNLFAENNKISIFNKIKKSVVQIKTFEMPNMFSTTGYSQGTGFVIDKDGLIITNYHIIEEKRGIIVYHHFEDKIDTLPAYEVWSDEDLDLAVLKVDSKSLEPIKIADSNDITQGQEVLVLGYPGASAHSDNLIITWGLLSSPVKDSTIQTTATINPGNSGGPAVNMAGELVGIVFSKLVGISVESTGFLRNVKFIDQALNEIDSNEVEIDDYYGTEFRESYFDLCLAESIGFGMNDLEDNDDKILQNRKSIKMLEKIIEKDSSFYYAYYFLASYYLQEGLLYCEAYENSKAATNAQKFYDILSRGREKTSLSKLIEYNEKLDNQLDDLVSEDEIDCKLWREILEYKDDWEEKRDERYADFYDYLIYGKTPEKLKEAIEKLSGSSTFTKKPVTLNFYNRVTFDNPYDFEREVQSQCIEIGIETAPFLHLRLGFYPRAESISRNNNSNLHPTLIHFGLSYWGYELKYTMNTFEDCVVPLYSLGFSSRRSDIIKNEDIYYGFNLLIFDLSTTESDLTENVGMELFSEYKIYRNYWIGINYLFHPNTFSQLGFMVGYHF